MDAVNVVDYLPLARKMAWLKYKKTPKHITYDELKSAAYMGLVLEGKKYNHTMGSFSNYASIKISGEIKDYLKSYSISGRYKNVKLSREESLDNTAEKVDSAVDNADELDYILSVSTGLECDVLKMLMIGEKSVDVGLKLDLSGGRISQILKGIKENVRKRQVSSVVGEIRSSSKRQPHEINYRN